MRLVKLYMLAISITTPWYKPRHSLTGLRARSLWCRRREQGPLSVKRPVEIVALLWRERIQGFVGGTGVALEYSVPVPLQLSYPLLVAERDDR
jgi:hypothetical protein